MKHRKLLLLFIFLLSSCAPAATATPTPTPTQTLTPAPTATQTPSPTPTITPNPTPTGGGMGKLIFEYHRAGFEKSFPDLEGEVHVFISNVDGTNLIPVTSRLKGFNRIEGISPDGKMVLVSSRASRAAKGDLYLINLNPPGSDPIKLANGLEGSEWSQAVFLDNTHIVYMGRGPQGYGFYAANSDGTNRARLGGPNAQYAGIVSFDKTRIYYAGFKNERFKDSLGVLYAYGNTMSLWWINIDGSGQGKLESNERQVFPGGPFGREVAFSPDGTSIAWIPGDLEPGCSLLSPSFWTPYIRNGTYTETVGKPSMFLNKDSPHFGKVIDMAYVEDYVRRCFVMHVASLSDMDNIIKIPLIPPFDPAKKDFYYHNEYDELRWWPDSSKILLYDGGGAMWRHWNHTNHYPMTLYEVAPNDTNPGLVLLKVLSDSSRVQDASGIQFVDTFSSFNFSPDGHQMLFARHRYGNQGSMIKVLNLETMYVDEFSRNITPDFQVQRIGSIYWLP